MKFVVSSPSSPPFFGGTPGRDYSFRSRRTLLLTATTAIRSVGAGGAPLHRFAVPLALSGEASLCCNVYYKRNKNGSPERVELSGGQFDSVKSSLDSCQRQLTEGLSPKGLTSCVKGISISRLDKGGTPGYNEDKRGHCYL